MYIPYTLFCSYIDILNGNIHNMVYPIICKIHCFIFVYKWFMLNTQ